MSNIRVDVDYTIKDGTEIKFKSPVDCSQVTGLIVYYPGVNGNTVSKVFVLSDAHGNNVGDINHLFAENVAVKVILDVTTSMAFVQNADTNAYLEAQFAKKAPASGFEAYYSVSTDAELNAKIAELTEAQPAKTEKTYGFYLYYTSGNDLPTGAMSVTIHKHSSTDASVTATSFYNRVIYLHRELYNGTWKEWEWENPPMAHGHSYRTTEKLDNGKAVYTRLVNCGEAANGKKTTISGAGDINIIRYEGTIGDRSLPYIYETMDNAMSAWVCISSYSIYLYCGSSQVGNNYSVQIWYTKDNE